MSTPNPHEAAAREAKAQRLAHRAVEALVHSANTSEEFWASLFKADGSSVDSTASPETRARVVAILRMLRPVKMEGWNL